MTRYFNNQEVELLAPAGNFEIFVELLSSKADAFYLGGKSLNMRMHRKNFNFTNDEILEAINLAHKSNKKIYITLNNMLTCEDIKTAKEFLRFLEKAKPDALIIQDMSIIKLIHELNIKIELHSSIMMNVHNIETIKRLRSLGITRIVASREMSLENIKKLSSQTDMEFEYFTHGDMCVAHGSQCLYSTLLFGQSSNRGRCMKPCRWDFSINYKNTLYNTSFPLAVKDLSLYQHLPEMIDSNVLSFKIEGRMRSTEYLKNLINTYATSLDSYIANPKDYDPSINFQSIFDNRNRDLSTAYAFKKPGLENINTRYEGTGKFYSTGKVFSKPKSIPSIDFERVEYINNLNINHHKNILNIAIRVDTKEQALLAIKKNISRIYLSSEPFEPNKPLSTNDIQEIIDNKKNSKIYIATPTMMYSDDFKNLDNIISEITNLDGLLVSNLGAINYFKNRNLELIGDSSLNIYNSESISFYENEGLCGSTLSIETKLQNLQDILNSNSKNLELIVHGLPSVMYLENDLFENLNTNINKTSKSNNYFSNNTMVLVDNIENEHPVCRDSFKRNHILPSKEICLLPILPAIANTNISTIRIESNLYTITELEYIIDLYQTNLNKLNKTIDLESIKIHSMGLTLGALAYN